MQLAEQKIFTTLCSIPASETECKVGCIACLRPTLRIVRVPGGDLEPPQGV